MFLVNTIREHHQTQLDLARAQSRAHLDAVFRRFNIDPPPVTPTFTTTDSGPRFSLDIGLANAMTELASRADLDLPALVELHRHQTSNDYRPNKALRPRALHALYAGYKLRDHIVAMADEGFVASWTQPNPTQATPLPPHKSASEHLNALTRALRDGQDAGQYLILNDSILQRYQHIQCSPLAVVPKKGLDMAFEARTIHDMTFGGPTQAPSTNSMTLQDSLPTIEWPKVAQVAARIAMLNRQAPPGVMIMGKCGDVHQAFRNLRAHASITKWFGTHIPELGIIAIDLSAAFGWTGSPALYCSVGNGIAWLVGNESPNSLNPHLSTDTDPFWPFVWVDDHVLIEYDLPDRLTAADLALRLAMVATLGPEAINEKKFTSWDTQMHALGLDWDLTAATVSMPTDKIVKARDRVESLTAQRSCFRSTVQETLGSLRHVASCNPATLPFIQRLHQFMTQCPPRGRKTITADARADLACLRSILRFGKLQGIPCSMYARSSRPDIHIYADACDSGLAVLDPQYNRFIRIQFNEAELHLIQSQKSAGNARSNHSAQPQPRASPACPVNTPEPSDWSINFREHLCVALAVYCWGQSWSYPASTTHVHFWSDNSATVSWVNHRLTSNRSSQGINRLVGLCEAAYQLHVTAAHLPGICNRLPDAGSRAHLNQTFATTWRTGTIGWAETPVPSSFRSSLLNCTTDSFAPPWPRPRTAATPSPGVNGSSGAAANDSTPCSPPINAPTPSIYCASPRPCSPAGAAPATRPTPVCPRSAHSRFITELSSDTPCPCLNLTGEPCAAWPVHDPSTNAANRPPSGCSPPLNAPSISPPPTTAPYGALRSWAISSYYEVQKSPTVAKARSMPSKSKTSGF